MAHKEQRSRSKRNYIIMGVALIALLAGGGIVINHFANESSKTLVFQEEPVRLKLDQSYDHFEGWGTSLAWWANDLGGWKDQAKVSEVMDLVFDPGERIRSEHRSLQYRR